MPLWLRWVLTLAAFAALTVAVVILVSRDNGGDQKYSESPAAEAQANAAGQAVSAKDQAAHQAPFPRSLAARAALESAIRLDMRTRVARHDLSGPVQHAACSPLTRKSPDRLPFRCHAIVGGFAYPFVGVADLRTHVLIWCKDDRASYDPSVEAPLSPACVS